MHNLHFIVVEADSAEEAVEIADSEIEGYGNEDNYYSIIGVIDEKGNKTKIKTNRWSIDNLSLKKIKELLLEVLNNKPYNPSTANNESTKLWMKYKNAEWEYETYMEKLFDIWDPDSKFYDHQYDKVGLTNMCYGNNNKYIVVIDMHS